MPALYLCSRGLAPRARGARAGPGGGSLAAVPVASAEWGRGRGARRGNMRGGKKKPPQTN